MKRTIKLLPDWSLGLIDKPKQSVYNPKNEAGHVESSEVLYSVFNYDAATFEASFTKDENTCESYVNDNKTTWIHVAGLKTREVENLCRIFGVHQLVVEDILSKGQRAKVDEIGDVMFTLLPIFHYNVNTAMIEVEQLSLVLGKDFVLSFQENAALNIFDNVTRRLKKSIGKPGKNLPDFLAYAIIDLLVDSYFGVIEQVNTKIENIEDDMLHRKEQRALNKITYLRRELINLYRNLLPVRDVVLGFLRSDNDVLAEQHEKYFKDVLDHITQANEYTEGQREMLMSIQDLLMSQINLKMNEVMKAFTMVATLLAPATVIGGIFGMNFDKLPLQHSPSGFVITVTVMLVIPVVMLFVFKRKGWF